MKPGSDPTRRNRNIGTASQGHGADNRMTIPDVGGCARVYWENLRTYHLVKKQVSGQEVLFIVEELTQGYIHPSSIGDVCKILNAIPSDDWNGIGAIYFRQPTKKENVISPTWGRLAIWCEIGSNRRPAIYQGPAILLPAQQAGKDLRWSRSLAPDDQRELERLQRDGHTIGEDKRGFTVQSNRESLRNTQLYRTLLHEIGHWVDWKERVGRPSELNPAHFQNLSDAYWGRPRDEREKYAHGYANDMHRMLRDVGAIPFDLVT